jgi:hypothetical protein
MNDVRSGFGWESSKHLSDRALLDEVGRVSRAHRVLTAELVAHLAEVDARQLYLREATPSMFTYCVKRLGYSEDEACRRIETARMVRKWPMILGRIGSGELSLTVLGKLKSSLTNENVSELVEAVSGLSVRDAERVLAERFPKPDVPDSIRKLPEGRSRTHTVSSEQANSSPSANTLTASGRVEPSETEARTTPAAGTHSTGADACPHVGATGALSGANTADPSAPRRPVDRGSFQPLSAERIQVKFTASRELVEKIALARDLMSHQNPRGDLATIVEAALDLLIEDALKKKLGVTNRPQKKPRPPKRERVTSATRREVLNRDGLGCSFVNEKGERCGARAFLELDHRKAKGKGGTSDSDNIRMLCRAHNQAEAERVYGKAYMDRCRKKRNDDVRERTSSFEFAVGLIHPRRRGSPSSASRSKGDPGSQRRVWDVGAPIFN